MRCLFLTLFFLLIPIRTYTQNAEQAKYVGSFSVPREDDFSFGGRPLAFDITKKNLFVGAFGPRVALIAIPEKFPAVAQRLSPFVDLSGNTWNLTSDDGDWAGKGLAGVLHWTQNELLVTGSTYYDANNNQRRGHLIASWPAVSSSSWKTVGPATEQGMIAGYMTHVPLELQSRLKGKILTGQSGLPIISRGSTGPCVYSFDPEPLRTTQIASATPLVCYPRGHATLGPWEGSSPMYGMTSEVGGVTFIDDWLVFVGSNGIGPACYGSGTGDPAKHDTRATTGEHLCYDPVSSYQGNHSYPYRPQAWAYPVSDLIDVTEGRKTPWSLVPKFWALPLPVDVGLNRIGGAAFDPATRRLYISQMGAETVGFLYLPLIHVFEVPGIVPPPLPTPEPATDLLMRALEARIVSLEKIVAAFIAALKQ